MESEHQIKSQVFDRLVAHLRANTDLQNIDLMNLAGFCRNCLAKWYTEEAKKQGRSIDYEESRELIYGMTYAEWKEKYQK
ncbi:MAG: DUF1244 domain-containing protein [Hyphomicrobiales bacterium]